MSPEPTAQTAGLPRDVASSSGLSRVLPGCGAAGILLALGWLTVAGTLSLLASAALSWPDAFGGNLWLAFGRLEPAARAAWTFGFALPAAWLAMAAVLGRVSAGGPSGGTGSRVGLFFWNLAALLGVVGILAGGQTGLRGLDMPGGVWPLFLVLSLAAGVYAWRVLCCSSEATRALTPAQAFLVTGGLWLPVVLLVAAGRLVYQPTSGVLETVVATWAREQLHTVCLSLVCLGVVFEAVPRLTGRPLARTELGWMGLGLLAWFGGWPRGMGAGLPLPAWLPALSTVASVLLLVPVVALTLYGLGGMRRLEPGRKPSWALRFYAMGMGLFLLGGLLQGALALREWQAVLGVTLAGPGVEWLWQHGFVGMILLGALWEQIEEAGVGVAGRLTSLVFGCLVAGLLLTAGAWLVGGVWQGCLALDPAKPFAHATKIAVRARALGMAGEGLWVLGACLLLGRCLITWLAAAGRRGLTRWREWRQPETEVAS